MSATPQYVRYRDDIEVIQPDEEHIIRQIVESMGRVNRKVYDRHRHAIRDAHAKSHGIVTGTLEVYDGLPAHLRQGVFAVPRRYPVIVRFSTAPGDIHSDSIPAPRGMAIKMLDVPGPKLLEGQETASTQDWLLVNHPTLPFGDIQRYLKLQAALEKHADDSETVLKIASSLAQGAHKALQAVGLDYPKGEILGAGFTHILGETFHSMAAVRYGEYIAKLSAAPLSANVRALTGQAIESDQHSALRDLVVAFFSGETAEYELRVQLCTDLERMPVEDASVKWPEEASPHQPVARLVLPPQDAYSAARQVYGDDILSFTPWHTVAAHRPLGSIMRVRKAAYERSSLYRHTMNQQPRIEPASLDEVPQ